MDKEFFKKNKKYQGSWVSSHHFAKASSIQQRESSFA